MPRHHVLVLDDLCNSSRECISRLEQLTLTRVAFIKGDVRDSNLLDDIFRRYDIDAVVHFASLKSVAESVHKPLGLLRQRCLRHASSCAKAMARNNVFQLVFSFIGHGVRRACTDTHCRRGRHGQTGQPLWPHQAHDRRVAHRSVPFRSTLEHRAVALLQPDLAPTKAG